jgi:transcriptional regulator with XRE-family HTH domain
MAKAARGRKTHRNTEGRQRLVKYLKPVGAVSQASLAAVLKIGQQTISAWKRGSCRPEPHHRDALARIAGIPADCWYSPDELAISRGAPVAESKAS